MTLTAHEPETAGVTRAASILQATLVDLIDLSLQAKQAHWTVTGPLFKPLHEHLDAIVDDLRTAYDDVAERIAAIGIPPDGRPGTVVERSSLDPLAAGWIPDAQAVERILGRLRHVSATLRTRIDQLAEVDPVSQDLLIGICHGIDKHAWMLRVQATAG